MQRGDGADVATDPAAPPMADADLRAEDRRRPKRKIKAPKASESPAEGAEGGSDLAESMGRSQKGSLARGRKKSSESTAELKDQSQRPVGQREAKEPNPRRKPKARLLFCLDHQSVHFREISKTGNACSWLFLDVLAAGLGRARHG